MNRPYSLQVSVALPAPSPVAVAVAPGSGGPVPGLAAPGTRSDTLAGIVATADSDLVRGTALPWAVVARYGRADLAERLRRAGAWMVLDASRVAGCARIERKG